MDEKVEIYKNKIKELELKISELTYELADTKTMLDEEKSKHDFFQLIADFTYGWELWFDPSGKIKYCSPSSFDITGFTANQIVHSSGIAELLVYEPDRAKYQDFIAKSLDQLLVNQTLEFRILTRTKQLRWCMMNARGVYDKLGKYMGIRASIHDISRLKSAMGHIQDMETKKDFEERTKQRLQTQLTSKDRELVSFLLQLSQKNELLALITNELGKLKIRNSEPNKSKVKQLLNILKNRTEIPLDWSMIEGQVEKTNPGFLKRLQTKHPAISVNDKKICTYIQLGFSSKEISGLMQITPKSVEIARVRLRKKLKLPSKIRLVNYLNQI